ncbi:MAG: hypothetical protein U0174_28085 [Polyangiaceae bacterium]
MKRGLTTSLKSLTAGILALAAGFATTTLSEGTASAQEIQLTGPLAGQPPIRKQRLYREGRFEIAPTWSFSLLDEYRRTMVLGARLQYNVTEWLGLGAWGGYGLVSYGTNLADQVNDVSPRSTRTQINIGKDFNEQTAKMQWFAVPQATFSPFRGKLALFQSIFADTDLYLHLGAAFVGIQERAECGTAPNVCSLAGKNATLASRVAVAPSFGLGLTLYPSSVVSFGAEYRALPFSWNRSGFDSRGGGNNGDFPDTKVNSEDRTFKFNQMVTLFVGFSFPNMKISD